MSTKGLKRLAGLIPTTYGYGRGVMSGAMACLADHPEVEILWFQEDYPPADMLREWGAEGIMGIFSKQRPQERYLSLNVPMVNVSSYPCPPPVVNVGVDQEQVGRLAAEHLQETGLSHFAYLGVRNYQFSKDRGRAFKEALTAETVHTCILPPTMWTWLEALHAWVAGLPKPCGVFCAGDNEARMLLSVCRTLGVAVPNELAVLGANNEEDLCTACTPPLSSVPVRAHRIGFEAMALLVSRVSGAGGPAKDLRISPAPAVQRASTDVSHVAEDPAIADTLRYLRTHLHEGVGVEQLAARYPGSRRTFELHFKKQTGHTPLAEIHAVRLERITQLLRDTDLPQAEIAERCGIATINHLCAFYKKHRGESPGRFRQRIRRGD